MSIAERQVGATGQGRNTLASTGGASWGFQYRGFLGGLLLIPASIVTVFSAPAFPGQNALNLTFDLIGWSAFLCGTAWRVWATCYVGGRKRRELVTAGPYSLCRNPLYLGSLLVALSAGFFMKSVVLGGAVALLALIYVGITIPAEERQLLFVHGPEYEAYCRRTRRLWPRLTGFFTPDQVELDVRSLAREAKRMALWLWLPFLCEVASYLRLASWWPKLFNLG